MLAVNGTTSENAVEIRELVERLVRTAGSYAYLALKLTQLDMSAKPGKQEFVFVRLADSEKKEPVLVLSKGRMIVRCEVEGGKGLDLIVGPDEPLQNSRPVAVAREF